VITSALPLMTFFSNRPPGPRWVWVGSPAPAPSARRGRLLLLPIGRKHRGLEREVAERLLDREGLVDGSRRRPARTCRSGTAPRWPACASRPAGGATAFAFARYSVGVRGDVDRHGQPPRQHHDRRVAGGLRKLDRGSCISDAWGLTLTRAVLALVAGEVVVCLLKITAHSAWPGIVYRA
jgi:hypothetical protein